MINNENIDEGNISISQKVNEKTQIIFISGKLVYQNMSIARDKINNIIGNYDVYILDFTVITKIDSTGFGLIFSIIKQKANDSKIVAVVSDPFILELFTITKMNQLFPIYPSELVALESLN